MAYFVFVLNCIGEHCCKLIKSSVDQLQNVHVLMVYIKLILIFVFQLRLGYAGSPGERGEKGERVGSEEHVSPYPVEAQKLSFKTVNVCQR